jgi:GcvH upstream region-like protein
MLGFFRRHQRYFFLMITIVIVISFSFFGTYSTINNSSGQDPVAFVAVDGTQIPRSELNQLVMFIGTDAEDKLLFGGIWGPNFLNDGVVKKDFFETGLAELLAEQYPGEIEQDLFARHEKEKRNALYSHPQAQFLSVASAWNYLAPDIKTHYDALRKVQIANSVEGFKERVDLYLAEKKLPAPMMRQLLLYQQQQYSWLSPDPNLERTDFSLFGYHTLEDWFGPRFLRLTAEFIINASIIAEGKGYQVSKADALADLMHNSEISFKQVMNSPNLGVATSAEYFNEQLHRMQLDKNGAVAIWKRVMLFRRLFHDVGNAVFVDPLMFQKYHEYAMETVEGQLYRLPPEFRLGSYRDLQKFEIYLEMIGKRPDAKTGRLNLPLEFLSSAELAKTHPELVQKRYLLEVAKYDKDNLQSKVGVKETWNWEVDEQNWNKLQKQFADLGTKKGSTREERFAALDSLDDKTRNKVDEFARKLIVESHPEWLDKALQEAETQSMVVGLRLKGGKPPFMGLKNNEELMKLLDRAKLKEQEPGLAKYSADGNAFYRISVVDRSPNLEILTFKEAQQEGTLDDLLNKKLENTTADQYFAPILDSIYVQYAAAIGPGKAPKMLIPDISASLRFYQYFTEILNKAKKQPSNLDAYVYVPPAEVDASKLPAHKALGDQWKLEKIPFQSERGKEGEDVNLVEAFDMKPNFWSSIQTPANGDLHMFYLTKRGNDATMGSLGERISSARHLLSDDAQRILMKRVLHEIKEKRAISLDYLNQGSEMEG